MSFVIGLCFAVGLFAGGTVLLFFRQRIWVPLAASIIVFAGCLSWFLTPICVAILEEDLANFSPPISTRTQTGMVGQRYFQLRNGVWFHCKVRIARQLFF